MITTEKKIFINLKINGNQLRKLPKYRFFVYANAPDNTKYRLDNHCIALNSHKTCHLLDGCQARKPHTQKLVFQRRYTYLPGEDILHR